MTKKRKALLIASVVLLGILAGGAYLYFAWWTPNQRMRDLKWWENATQDEIRSTCHQVLRFPWGNHHDAFITLAGIGNAESVPLLIHSLRWQDPPTSEGYLRCTTAHAVTALQSLTGQHFQFEPDRWRNWWNQTGCRLPAPDFFPRQIDRVGGGPTAASQVPETGVNEFALDLYSQLTKAPGTKGKNLFFSPFSIHTALDMTHSGARGETAAAMRKALRLKLPDDRIHPAMGALIGELNQTGEAGGFKLNVVNALWGQKGEEFLPAFLEVNRKHYGAGLERLDFHGAAEKARETINTWVADKTSNTIRDLIPPGLLGPSTNLVLTNAVYFKADWQSVFNKIHTAKSAFHLNPRQTVQVSTMFQKHHFKYAAGPGLQMLEMPYKGNRIALVVLLPDEKGNLAALERKLTKAFLDARLGELQSQEVAVFLPKFKFTSMFELKEPLSVMGMGPAFNSGIADFSGMDGSRSMSIGEVLHKAFVAVDEKGTEAGAATAVTMLKGFAMKVPPTFRADRPFLFLIRDTTSGSILFMGRVMDPS